MLTQKLDVIKEKEKGASCRKSELQFGIGKTQIQSTVKRKREIMEALETNASPNTKRLKTSQHYDEVNKLRYEWYLDAVAVVAGQST